MIAEWWTSLSVIMKVLWGITLAASFIFIIQTVMTFLGADAGGDFDMDAGGMDGVDMSLDDASGADMGTGMNLYTFRNLVNFLLGFGWSMILLQDSIASKGLLIIISLLVGLALVTMVMYLFKWLSGMQQSGTINIYKQAVGCQGKVYLSIPAARSGQGKVQITINNSIREYDAVTDGEALPTGTAITVSDVIDGNTVLVETSNSLII